MQNYIFDNMYSLTIYMAKKAKVVLNSSVQFPPCQTRSLRHSLLMSIMPTFSGKQYEI